MAFKVGQVTADVTADTSSFNRSMGSVRKKGESVAGSVQSAFRSVGQRMQRIGMGMSAAITAPLVGAGGLALKTAADFESLRQSMDILNGSAEEGARNFERLKEFSAGTPFQLRGLAEAQNMLQGFGLTADDAFDSIKMIGDIAAVSGGDIKGIGIAFGQAAAEGRLMTRDIRQLINQGVPAIKLLADTMGVAQSEVLDLASQGEISFDILQQAFRDATSEGGMFANGMAKQAQTLQGLFSTLKDNISIALNEIGQSLSQTFDIKGLITGLTSQIQNGIEWFNSLSEETRKTAFYVAGLLGASGPIIAALGTLSLALGAISGPIAGAVAAVAGGAALLIKNWETVENYFTTGSGAQMWQTIKDIVDKSVKAITALWDVFGENIINTAETSFRIISEAIRTSLNAISLLLDVWTGKFITDFDGFMQNAENIASDTFGRDGSMTIIFEEFLSWINSSWIGRVGSSLSRGLANAVMGAFESVSGIDMPFIRSLDKQLAEEISFRQAERAIRRAKKHLLDQLQVEDVIIDPEIDFSMPDMDIGEKMTLFTGKDNPIDKANAKVQGLAASVGETLTPQMNRFRETAWNAMTVGTEGMSLFEIATQGVQKQLTTAQKAGMQFGQLLGNAFSQAALHAKRLDNILLSVAKQLASRAIVTGLQILLTGGVGSMGFFGTMFGGFRAHGGPVSAGKGYVVGENGPELFMPRSSGQIVSNKQMSMGGTKKVQLSINGQFVQRGSDLRAVINESQYIDLN